MLTRSQIIHAHECLNLALFLFFGVMAIGVFVRHDDWYFQFLRAAFLVYFITDTIFLLVVFRRTNKIWTAVVHHLIFIIELVVTIFWDVDRRYMLVSAFTEVNSFLFKLRNLVKNDVVEKMFIYTWYGLRFGANIWLFFLVLSHAVDGGRPIIFFLTFTQLLVVLLNVHYHRTIFH